MKEKFSKPIVKCIWGIISRFAVGFVTVIPSMDALEKITHIPSELWLFSTIVPAMVGWLSDCFGNGHQ